MRRRRVALGLFVASVVWWATRTPSNDRDWPLEQSRVPHVEIDGHFARIDDIRHFTYRTATDVDARWESRIADLDRVRGLDVIVSDWGWRDLVHTIVSWDVEGEAPLTISIESRRERDEPFNPLFGILRQYELLYVIADEQDVVTLRAAQRHETVRLYRTSTSAELARRLLVSYLNAAHGLETEPAFYDSLRSNCSTTTRRHLAEVGVEDTWDWRVLLNGHIDALLYERGLLDTSLSLEELRARSDITQVAIEAAGHTDFSERIRAGLPQP